MSKTFCKTLIKVGKFEVKFQRFNGGYKNLPVKYYKNGICKYSNSKEKELHITLGVYKLIFITKK